MKMHWARICWVSKEEHGHEFCFRRSGSTAWGLSLSLSHEGVKFPVVFFSVCSMILDGRGITAFVCIIGGTMPALYGRRGQDTTKQYLQKHWDSPDSKDDCPDDCPDDYTKTTAQIALASEVKRRKSPLLKAQQGIDILSGTSMSLQRRSHK